MKVRVSWTPVPGGKRHRVHVTMGWFTATGRLKQTATERYQRRVAKEIEKRRQFMNAAIGRPHA